MLSVNRITSVEYYEAADRTAAIEAGKDPSSPQAGRDEVAYYTDNGAGESQGVWWTRTVADLPEAERPSSSLPPSSPLLLPPSSPFGRDGGKVAGRHLRDLAAGRHPWDRERSLVKTSGNKKRSVGFDCQVSAPKSVSAYAAVMGDETREKIFAVHDRAVGKMMDRAFTMGLLSARMSIDGVIQEVPASAVSAATYRHFTSRAKDPQLHTHCVVMNLAIRPDGTTGTLDSRQMLLYGGALAAIYRSELAAGLKETLGVELVKKGRNFEIAGFPEEIIETFSKRREAIVKGMDGDETATNRQKAQTVANDTRDAKDREASLDELEERWQRELRDMGWSPEALSRSVRIEGDKIRSEVAAKGESRDAMLDRLARQAVDDMTENLAVLDDRLVMRDVMEALQCHASADEALQAFGRLKTSGFLVEVGKVSNVSQREREAYSTRRMIELERDMLLSARARKGEREWIDPALIEAGIARRPTMREDQAKAVRHALNRDGVAVVQGFAGTGKSFSMGTVADIVREAGHEVYVVAPSWKATEVIRQDTASDTGHAFAVPGFLSRVEKGLAGQTGDDALVLKPGAVVILDEAGMVGVRDMARLVAALEQAGCKLVATGDVHQLQPVTAGAPLAALDRVLGNATLSEITRQRIDWQRAASQLFPKGKSAEAVAEYARHGRLQKIEGRDETIEAIVEHYVERRLAAPEKSRAILSSWNADVRAINAAIRERGKAEGWIGQDDVTLTVIPRGGKDPKPAEFAFAAGDEIIFGETVKLPGLMLRNADIARIDEIVPHETDPTLVFTLAKGGQVRARMSELVGSRKEGEPAVPKMQHVSAMTISAAQGVTVDECVVGNFRGMGRESAYVAMTRHRDDVRMFIDTSRLVDTVMAEEGGSKLRQTAEGRTIHKEEEDETAEVPIADLDERVDKMLVAEFGRANVNANASQFYGRIEDFIDGKPPGQNAEAPEVDAETAQRRRMAERLALPVAFPVPKGSGTRLVTAQEFDYFRRVDLAAFAEQEGLEPVGDWETNAKGVRFRIYQDRSKPDGSKVSIARMPDGTWLFRNRENTVSGDITKLLQWKTGRPSIKFAHDLRRYFQTPPDDRKPLTVTGPVIRYGTQRDHRGTAEATPSKDRNMETVAPVKERLTPEQKAQAQRLMRLNWRNMSDGVNEYLVKVRGILPEILNRFRSEIRTEPNDPRKPWFKGGMACFAHRDLAGNLVGYERKGVDWQADGKRSFSRMVKGSDKTSTMMGDTRNPARIYIGESSVETLSMYQHEGAPERSLLCSPYGQFSVTAAHHIAQVVKRHPNAEVHFGFNNDVSGRAMTAKLRALIEEVCGSERVFVDKSPDREFNDWNDQIRGITAVDAAAAKARRVEEARAQELAQVRAQEEERKRREEAERKARAEEAARRSTPSLRL